MTENRPWQSADPSLLKRGREHDAIHGPQSGSGELRKQSMRLTSAKPQSGSEFCLLTHLIWLLAAHQY